MTMTLAEAGTTEKEPCPAPTTSELAPPSAGGTTRAEELPDAAMPLPFVPVASELPLAVDAKPDERVAPQPAPAKAVQSRISAASRAPAPRIFMECDAPQTRSIMAAPANTHCGRPRRAAKMATRG